MHPPNESIRQRRRITGSSSMPSTSLLKDQLASRQIRMTAEVKTVLNAIFVVAPKERLAELKALPGVKGVVAGRRYHLNLNKATGLVDAPGAWSALGGIGRPALV